MTSARLFDVVAIPLATRPRDIDGNGHVNNAVIHEYLEVGRWAWTEHMGMSKKGNILLFLTRTEVDYRREIEPGQIVVSTKLVSSAEDHLYRAVFEHTIESLRDSGAVVTVEARVEAAFVGADDRCLRPFHEFLDERLPDWR